MGCWLRAASLAWSVVDEEARLTVTVAGERGLLYRLRAVMLFLHHCFDCAQRSLHVLLHPRAAYPAECPPVEPHRRDVF